MSVFLQNKWQLIFSYGLANIWVQNTQLLHQLAVKFQTIQSLYTNRVKKTNRSSRASSPNYERCNWRTIHDCCQGIDCSYLPHFLLFLCHLLFIHLLLDSHRWTLRTYVGNTIKSYNKFSVIKKQLFSGLCNMHNFSCLPTLESSKCKDTFDFFGFYLECYAERKWRLC